MATHDVFRDRAEAGRQLALHLDDYSTRPDVLVLGLARGGVPVAFHVALPVAPPEVCKAFEHEVDRTVCAHTPELFYAVGAWYDDFSQVTDEEVRELLRRAAELHASGPAGPEPHLHGVRDA